MTSQRSATSRGQGRGRPIRIDKPPRDPRTEPRGAQGTGDGIAKGRTLSSNMPEVRRSQAAIYGRTSNPKQASVPTQVELCRRAAELGNHEVRYILKEEGIPAKDMARPKLQHLMRLVESHRIDLIIVWKMDRLVRSLRDLMNLYDFLERHGVGLMSVTEPFNTETSFGRFTFRQAASFAELERDIIGERSSMGKFAQAVAGRWPTQEPPLGYRLAKGRNLVIEPNEADIVRRIFAMYARGVPVSEISRQLARKGIFSRDGISITPRWITKILHNPIYDGRLVILGQEHARPNLRLVTSGMRAKVEARRGKRVRDGKAGERRGVAADAIVEDYLAHLADPESAKEPWRPFNSCPPAASSL